ncbi:DNA polymerase III subunit beta [Bradyrhizobium sp. 186]|uniref:DNA polymerase III subunit beta n=1 Tax=Bradyrhizobium sp. 186 TaxID=2782654 RepID=UPI002001AC0A|nr:DNA polymerase III subunit beta [Bradyrhizobium sp. 186]UPK35552.1 DNA polymerase III subunit beta [Bradyrhizobium sp. 186]
MKLTATAAAIGNALSLAAAARQRNGLVSITAGEGIITVACSDPGMTITANVAGNVAEPGAAAVSGDRLGALISGFDPRAAITISGTTNAVTIERYRLPTADLPVPLAMDGETDRIQISGQDCIALLGVAPAADTERTRFYLCGIFLHTVEGRLFSVSTNGTKLLRHSVPAAAFSDDATLIVPSKTATTLARLIRQTKADKVTLRRSPRLFAASGAGFEITSRLIGGATYPDYRAALPPPTPNHVTVDTAELQAALTRLTAIAIGDVPLIALTWTEGAPLHVSLPRQPGDGADDIDAETKGSARIALQPAQLAGMLTEFGTNTVNLNVADRLLISSGDRLGVLMPCSWNFGQEGAAAVA